MFPLAVLSKLLRGEPEDFQILLIMRTEKVCDAVLAFVGAVLVILACNPLSMFVFNLFFPEYASRFTAEFIGFPQALRRFYTKYALKWPYWWAKHWITLGNLNTCSARKQVAFYRDNDIYKEVVKLMSPEAQVMLVRRHFELIERIYSEMRLTDEMFAEWLQQLIKQDAKKEHSLDFVKELYAPLENYLKKGKLPFSQMMLLLHAAVEEYDNSACPLMSYVYDYIERFGMSEKQLKEMAQYMCDNLYWHSAFSEKPTTEMAKEFAKYDKFTHFFGMLHDRQVRYEQRIFTRTHRLANQADEWRAFCTENTYICPAAQKEMSINQYTIYHEAGYVLCVEAIAHFLRYPDRNLHRLVFRYEPLEILQKSEIQALVESTIFMRDAYDEEVAKRTEKS